MPAELHKEHPYSFTIFSDIPIAVCNDCGATAPAVDAVRHYAGCKPGESEKWARFYSQAHEEELQASPTLEEITRLYYGEL